MRGRILSALVEHHGDIRSERPLNFNRFLWREHVFTAIEMGTETHAFIVHSSQLREAENLKASRIRQNGPAPRHELVQPAHAADQLVPGPQIEMISIRKQQIDV